MKPNGYIKRLATYEATHSTHRFRVGSVIYGTQRTPIGWGYNKADKTHPASWHPFKSIHSEFAAFLVAFRRLGDRDMKHLSIYTHRLMKDGTPGLAKPCPWCKEMLVKVGFKEKNIYWSE
jgi:cytidine deaminase